ncbi:MAG: hypothetical protein ACREJM_04980 [Candidatus Saccharimonadales bacterium]
MPELQPPNPYQSPSGAEQLATEHRRVRGAGFWVLLNIAWNVYRAVRYSAHLTVANHLIGAALWFVLPLVALGLLRRNRRTGRWILIGLFGLRSAVSLYFLADFGLARMFQHPVLLFAIAPHHVIDALLYTAATAWLLFFFGRTPR